MPTPIAPTPIRPYERLFSGGQAAARLGDDVLVWDKHVDQLDV
jgi:hypothetical protein